MTSDSCLQPGKSRKISEITDGTNNTVIVVEVAPQDAVPWMSPQDADEILFLSFGPETKGAHAGGRHVAFADGTNRFVSQETASETLKALISATGGETIGEF